ncbi:Dihydrofolate reductase [Dyella jiangningensis]|uniref:dihydrofolate reductase family protein n=1 Tax=Dyella sp. AtDHG13 TaxID=1938897 RepID=UPI0008843D21|nr:dihydrofolate reductase family protein [Dyella sp. AtDHG13]PXV54091.1 dihydrofolate reductase [Dyella sp. AtDHG13]SDL08371.1 Dihydrofolate reductase [Dyella jiangningensis]
MRKLVLSMSMSLDGFVSGVDGDIQWVFSGDQEAIVWKLEQLWDASLIIMGSRSFQDMSPYWPTSTVVFAPPMNQIPKAVFSRQGAAVLAPAAKALKDARERSTAPLQPGAESWAQAYVASGDLADEIQRLKATDGKPIIAIGGATFARSLIAHGLVDEYMLMVYPIVLGRGLPIFADLPAPVPLKLIHSKTFPLGALAQTYQPNRNP